MQIFISFSARDKIKPTTTAGKQPIIYLNYQPLAITMQDHINLIIPAERLNLNIANRTQNNVIDQKNIAHLRSRDSRLDSTSSNTQRGTQMCIKILRLHSVIKQTALSRSGIYQKMSEGKFPKPISLGSRAVGWISSEIEEWISQRIQESRATESKK